MVPFIRGSLVTMTAIPYSADGAIADFFAAHSSVTREQCEAYALSLAGGPVTPVALQGSFSYTVVAGNKQSRIIQFRAQDSDLDRAVLDLAQRVHNEFVPSYTFHGLFCELLPVYGMDKVTGTPYVHVKPSDLSSETGPWHSKTVGDFARFFAAAWKEGQHLSPEAINAIKIDYETRFDLLFRRLPQRFQENLTLIRAGLPSLFDTSYPLALNHGDLSGLNIFVDPSTGRITGIIDWAEATIGPFGMSLWGLENLLGFMDGQGWHYYPNCDTLRSFFWQTFEQAVGGLSPSEKRAVQIARLAGLFLRYGFAWADGGKKPVGEGSMSFRYLDAFCAFQ